MYSTETEIEQALKESQDDIPFEQMMDVEDSPLNQPVKEKDIPHPESSGTIDDEPLDAPEQEIGDGYSQHAEVEIPESHAKMAAEVFLGMADNFLEVGGKFFVKIKKHKEFYDFEEVVQVIDEQNEKNVKRMKLDEADKVLLRPLLTTYLIKKAAKLTIEQQLIGAVLSILFKKVQTVMEIRTENELLEDRILQIVKDERKQPAEEQPEVEEGQPIAQREPESVAEQTYEPAMKDNGNVPPYIAADTPMASVLEVATDADHQNRKDHEKENSS